MSNLVCKYCGSECESRSGQIVDSLGSLNCIKSPSKKHILKPTGHNCVYCADIVTSKFEGLLNSSGSSNCPSAPNKRHELLL
jgi:hypothetical protein